VLIPRSAVHSPLSSLASKLNRFFWLCKSPRSPQQCLDSAGQTLDFCGIPATFEQFLDDPNKRLEIHHLINILSCLNAAPAEFFGI
jgi:hypothetical protein